DRTILSTMRSRRSEQLSQILVIVESLAALTAVVSGSAPLVSGIPKRFAWPLTKLALLALLVAFLYARKRRRKHRAPPRQTVVPDTLARTAEKPNKPTSPDFAAYTEDLIDDILWRWSWSPGQIGEPRSDCIVGLTPYCNTCDSRFEAKYDRFRTGGHYSSHYY